MYSVHIKRYLQIMQSKSDDNQISCVLISAKMTLQKETSIDK